MLLKELSRSFKINRDPANIIGERSEPPLSVELSEFSLYLYIYIYIYIYVYIFYYFFFIYTSIILYLLFIYNYISGRTSCTCR